jgi:hypothetical protein
LLLDHLDSIKAIVYRVFVVGFHGSSTPGT